MNLWNYFRRRPQLEKELDEELQAHLAMDVRDRMDRGQTSREAERDARRAFGNELLIREVTRDMWGWSAVEPLRADINYAFRQIRRTPGFTAVALLCLALGLGSTVTMFSIVNGILLKPLSFREPERLYLARTVPPPSAGVSGDFPVNARHFDEWRKHCRSCESTALLQFQDLTLVGEGEPLKLAALSVSAEVFRTLGVQPALGRDFLPGEGTPGPADLVILSDALWRSRFSADPAIVGRRILLNGEQHTVVGVMPSDLHLPKGDEWGAYFGRAAPPMIFRPLFIDPSRQRPTGNLNYTALIRLRPGVSPAQAESELNALLADFNREFNLRTRTVLIPLTKQVTGRYALGLWLLLSMIGAVLLTVCVNVGNLMLVRTAGRYREAGVRMALGAGQAQLLRLVMVEAGVLVIAGAIAGIGVAQAGLRLFVALAPVRLPRLDEVQLDWRALLLAAILIAICTAICGLFPAIRLSRIDPQESLKSAAGAAAESARKVHAREVLVGAEIAISTVLLVVGALLLMSFVRVTAVDRGFQTARLITQDVSYLSPKYARGARRQRIEETVRKLAQIPGVEIAAAINVLPLRGDDWFAELEDPGQPVRSGEQRALANFRFATPGYWQALGIPLKRGRYLEDFDKDQPRVIINESAAKYLWPNQDPLGRKVRAVGSPAISQEVVGVVGEVRASGLEKDPPMIVYEHYWRMQPVAMSYVVRTQPGVSATVAGRIRTELAAMDPEMAIMRPWTMEEIVGESLAVRRFQTLLALGFAICAVLLASLGVYGVISYSVARRTPEIGIRSALGASGREIVSTVVARGMLPVGAGIAVGLVGALLAGRSIASQLFHVAPADPVTFLAVPALLLLVGLAACCGPALRAARIDPVKALRFE